MANIFILQGNGDNETFCGELASAYEKGARLGGHTVHRINIGDLKFDPILHKGYKTIQELEPDLKKVQEEIKWCNHLVLLYPMWWSAMPSLLKGMFDRMWLPGFAYHFNHNGMGWHGLLHGKSARIIITMDSWPLVQRILFGDSTNEIARAVLKFSGFHPVHVKKIGEVKKLDEKGRESWCKMISGWGKHAH
jgi:NAD(P)H dehydrogenase (quinone)